jgi:hypothetical protein
MQRNRQKRPDEKLQLNQRINGGQGRNRTTDTRILAQRRKKHRCDESSRSGSACFAGSVGPWIIEVNGSI